MRLLTRRMRSGRESSIIPEPIRGTSRGLMQNALDSRSTMNPETQTAATPRRETRMSAAGAQLLDSLRQKTARVGVIGLGYVGLPLANLFHQKGFQVVGFDIDQRKVDSLLGGK